MKIKLCGFTDVETVNLAISLEVDFLGFVFHDSSPRNISFAKAQEISASIPKNIKKVAVIVDADDEKIFQIIKHLSPDFLQLHNHESPSRILEIKNKFDLKIIKAFGIKTINDLKTIKNYEEVADLFLFDAKVKEHGGSGQSFDWKILQNLNSKKEWFLSGGLNIKNVEEAIKISGAKMIDVSSGIEEIRGVKSSKLIKEFVRKARENKSGA